MEISAIQNPISSGSGILNGDKKEDDCGVYEEADNGFGFQENCEYIHETVIVVKAVITYPYSE